MTFASHTVLGAGLCALPFRWSKPWLRWTGFAFGAIGGAAPDVADWVAATFFGATRWVLYSRMHSGDLTWLQWHPAYALHLWLDSFIHDPSRPGWNWWPTMWPWEVGMWIVGIAFLWAAFGRKE